MTEALLGFGAVFVLALLRMPLAFAMGAVGFVGLGLLRGWAPTVANAAQVVYDTGFAYTLSVVPLFILMGNFVARAGLAHELFRAAYAFIGHLRGGLAHATVAGLRRLRRDLRLVDRDRGDDEQGRLPADEAAAAMPTTCRTGVIAAGGTLGIMIPPSTILVIYGIVTETNIGKLFAAGVLPGLLCAGLLMLGACPGSPGATRPPARPASARPGASAGARCATSGAWCCWCWSCSAASTAACSPPPKAPASARRARSSSRWRAAR